MAGQSMHGTVLAACERSRADRDVLHLAWAEASRRGVPLTVLATSAEAHVAAKETIGTVRPSHRALTVEELLVDSADDPELGLAVQAAVLVVVAGPLPGASSGAPGYRPLDMALARGWRAPVLVAFSSGAPRQSAPERRPLVRVGWSGQGDESDLLRAAANEARSRGWALGVVNVVPRPHRGQLLRREQERAWRAVHAVAECSLVPCHVSVSQADPVTALAGACRPGDLLVVAARPRDASPGRTRLGTVEGAVAGTDPVLPGILAQPPCDVLVLPPAPRLGEEPVDRVASLSRLLDPRSVAVVAERGSPLRGTLAVRVSTAERRRRGGETLYSLDHPADLAVVSAAPAELRGAVGACVDAGVGAVAVMARGSEVPDDVARDVAQVCREAGIRLLGPGVEVLANLGEHVALHAGMSLGVGAGHGRVAVVTQGPGLTGLMRVLASHDLGADLVVDVGRAVDVGVAEVAAWAATRGRVPAVLVLSAVPCRQALEAELSQAGRPSVPVVLLERGGASPEQGSRGVAPRVLRAETVDELANLALLFVGQPAPTGRHVAFVTNEPWASHAGVNRQLAGAGLLGADLTQHAEQRSKLLAPGASLRGAVLSLTPDVTADSLSEVLTTVTEERGVDAVVVAQRAGPHLHRADVERVLGTLRRDQPDVVVVAVDQSRQHPWRSSVVPVFDSDRHALDALAGLIRA